jgi:hypothetical protein
MSLLAASVAIRFLPFRRVAKLAERPPFRESQAVRLRQTQQVAWAIRACATRVPWRAVCFQQGLAAHFMLRRRQVPSILHYGITQSAERGLEAHVWVTNEGQVVIGGEEAARFNCVATFPIVEGQVTVSAPKLHKLLPPDPEALP